MIIEDGGNGTGYKAAVTSANRLKADAVQQSSFLCNNATYGLSYVWDFPGYDYDAGDTVNTYWQDSSLDFRDMGVSGEEKFILYNQTNGNYCFIGEVQKPSGQSKFCRVTLVDSNGDALTAADIDDDDVGVILKYDECGYPLSDIGAMT